MQIFVAGYSYGAATAALTVTRHPDLFRGVILLDGWFAINLADIPV